MRSLRLLALLAALSLASPAGAQSSEPEAFVDRLWEAVQEQPTSDSPAAALAAPPASRVLSPGAVAHWERHPSLAPETLAALRAAGFTTAHLVDGAANPFVPGLTRDAFGRAYSCRYGGCDQRLLDHGYGPAIDPLHGLGVQPWFDAQGIADPTLMETVDAAFIYGRALIAHLPGAGGAGGGGATCATADPYRGTPRESLRCRYFLLSGRCREWTGWSPPWPICCPGASPCPPGEPEEPDPEPPLPPVEPDPVEPPPPESESDACETALDAFRDALENGSTAAALRAAAEAAEVCRAD